jgi:hypothetical protein
MVSTWMSSVRAQLSTLDVFLFGREPAQVKLLEVLHTPDVPHNLISYTRMMSTGKFKSKDNGSGMVVRHKADGVVVLTTNATGNVLCRRVSVQSHKLKQTVGKKAGRKKYNWVYMINSNEKAKQSSAGRTGRLQGDPFE